MKREGWVNIYTIFEPGIPLANFNLIYSTKEEAISSIGEYGHWVGVAHIDLED